MTEKKKSSFGKGIGALLSKMDTEFDTNPQAVVEQLAGNIAMIKVADIEANPYQPRKDFDETALSELAQSIQTHGLIQPITVRRLAADRYQLISGERRFRAAQKINLEEVPAYIRIANDQEMLEMAIVENLLRHDLNAIEVAWSYQRLLEEFQFTHEQLSERLSKDRSTVTNYLRLLELPIEIQKGLREQIISMGHARALAGIKDIALQLSLYKEIIEKRFSVRQTEALVQSHIQPLEKKKKAVTSLPREYQQIQDRLVSHFSTKVALNKNPDGKGQIVIHFKNEDDLNRLLELMD